MIDEIDFIFPCPVDECINSNKLYKWFHHSCGGTLKLSSKGTVRCCKCRAIRRFMDWPFNCGNHEFIRWYSCQGVVRAMINVSALLPERE